MKTVDREHPILIILMVDQSGSMNDRMDARTKAEAVRDDVNKLILNMVMRATKGNEYRDYIYVSIVTYGSEIKLGLSVSEPGPYGNEILPISTVAKNMKRFEKKDIDNGAGDISTFELPIWLEAEANGGTPMTAAFTKVKSICETWLADPKHMECEPPIVINLTDGESTDGNPTDIARQVQMLSTNYGRVKVFNLHFAPGNVPIAFPDSINGLSNEFSRQLFEISSPLEPEMIEFGRDRYRMTLSDNARGYVFNGDNKLIIMALDIGTRVATDGSLR